MSKTQQAPKPSEASGVEPPTALREPHSSYEAEILRRAWDRLNVDNEHFMFCLVGREGSGKSHTAIRLASEIDPSFTHERVLFDVVDLLEILESGEHEPGNAYVLDEAGVSLGKRTWQERGQILANQAMQLIRDHNLALFFTLPRLGELDSQTQGRLHGFFEITEKVDGKHVKGKWKYMKPDRTDESGKIYKPYPKVERGGEVLKVTSVRFAPPSSEIVEPYQKEKRKYQKEFYREVIDEYRDGSESQDGEDELGPKRIAEQIQDEGVEQVVSVHGGNKQEYIDASLIELEYDVSQRDAKKVKKVLERDKALTGSKQG